MIKTTARELKDWQKNVEITYASFSGVGNRGSLSSTGSGIFIVRDHETIIYSGKDAAEALRHYNEIYPH